MIKSINGWAFDPNRPPAEVFRIAKAHRFAGVEVVIGDTGPLTFDSTPDDCRRIGHEAQRAGIALTGLAGLSGWYHPITAPDENVRRRGIELLDRALHIANWLGIDALLVVPGGVGAEFIENFQGAPYDVAYQNALAALRELKPVARETGVTLAIENVWNKFLLSPLEMRDFVDAVESPHVGCYFDVGNVVLTSYPEQWIRILGKRISRVHFKDFKRSIGTLDGFCPLLEGDVDYRAVMQALREIGYDGPVAAEFFNAEADLPKISRAMDQILAM